MPNPVERKFIVQLGPSVTAETGGTLAAWAITRGQSISTVTRLAIERGLESLCKEWAAESGPLGPGLLRRCTAEAHERGERQAARRTRTDQARRGRTDDAA